MDCDQYKLFVGGIPRETSEEALRQHFSRYGVVLGASIARERDTGKPRGFGFVCFSDSSSVDKALRDKHFIMDRAVDVKKAIPRNEQFKMETLRLHMYGSELHQSSSLHQVPSIGNYSTKKVFVGGLSSSITDKEFKNYFERYGRITDAVVMRDSATNRPRGFGFVTFDSEDSVEDVTRINFHELGNKLVEVKRAIPKEGIQTKNGSYNPWFVARNTPTYSSFQPTAFAPGRCAYEMPIRYTPPPPPPLVNYHCGLGFHHYPVDLYGYSHPLMAQGANMLWNNPIMPTTGFFYPPRSEAPGYFPYMMNGYGHMGMYACGYNAVFWPAPVNGANERVSAGMITPRFETLKLEVTDQTRNVTSVGGSIEQNQKGNAAKPPLQMDTCR